MTWGRIGGLPVDGNGDAMATVTVDENSNAGGGQIFQFRGRDDDGDSVGFSLQGGEDNNLFKQSTNPNTSLLQKNPLNYEHDQARYVTEGGVTYAVFDVRARVRSNSGKDNADGNDEGNRDAFLNLEVRVRDVNEAPLGVTPSSTARRAGTTIRLEVDELQAGGRRRRARR
ncbi:MAG: cadherin repeat domain-containing protein [Alphaproteobacteria bacterium]|nr:cadherin repeat domain-containing protein [Alphaproteobacteria bacterium]